MSPLSSAASLSFFRGFVFAICALLCNSCTPVPPNDGEVRIVEALALVRYYRDEPGPAGLAYDTQRVRILVTAYDRGGLPTELRLILRYGPNAEENRPVLVLKAAPGESFPDRKALTGEIYIEGVCQGREDDGCDRGVSGYTFKVTLTGCRLVPGPYPVRPATGP